MISDPIKLIYEAQHHLVTIETKSGDILRGHLQKVDDTMNCLIENCKVTSSKGDSRFINNIYIRGN